MSASGVQLWFDAALGACSVAVTEGEGNAARLRAGRFESRARGHAEVLVPMVVEVMAEAGCGFSELATIGATVGPGTFTGVRVGLATARGLALASGVEACGITTLQAVACNVAAADIAAASGTLAVAIDARRGELYFQLFDAGHAPRGAPALAAPGDLAARLPPEGAVLVGSGAAALAAAADAPVVLSPTEPQPDARVFARAAAAAGAAWHLPPRPLYLRAPDAKLPASSGVARR